MRALKYVGLLGEKKVLDVGCGNGRWMKLWTDLGAHVVGVNISVPLLKMHLRHHDGQDPQKHFAAMEAQNLGFESESFDMASSVTVLQHIPYSEQRQAIHEIVRCVKSGGWILIYEHIRKPPALSRENDTTFSNSPRDWVEMFAKENCQVVLIERCPLMPFFTAYWWMRKCILEWAKSRRVIPSRSSLPQGKNGADGNSTTRFMGKLYRFINYWLYWLLTWPSWALEYGLFIFPKSDRWTGQNFLGAHQTFLFQKTKNKRLSSLTLRVGGEKFTRSDSVMLE